MSDEHGAPAASFLSLLHEHERLDDLFLQHQEALLDADIPRASACLQDFAQGLRSHIRLEEEQLLPVYERAGTIPGGGVALFRGEHKKILEYLDRFVQTVAEMTEGPEPLKRKILQLLDEEVVFKHVMLHHDLRERNILYPVLDSVTEEQERRILLNSPSRSQNL